MNFDNNKNTTKKVRPSQIIWGVFITMIAVSLLWNVMKPTVQTIDTSDGLSILNDGKTVERVVITDKEYSVDLTLNTSYVKDGVDRGKKVKFYFVSSQESEIISMTKKADPPQGYNSVIPTTSIWESIFSMLIPTFLLLLVFWFFMSRMQKNSGNGVFGIGQSNAKIDKGNKPDVTFKDVAGADEAVQELQEIKEFLASPKKFKEVGAKIPKGVLLYGPPGTGKTLLARAVAGEANVPFFSISGSDFVEMFVGVGASRVRDLFDKAKAASPSIIFVDEIDAVGRHRGSGMGGGHDEREQTLNQLLVEMDGFDVKTNVIVIAATNRPDILDSALLRPGRFDRQIAVESPDLAGREAILKVHSKGKPLAKDVDLYAVAKATPGFTGADLANVLNEAALLTARENKKVITNEALDESIDRVMAGPKKAKRALPKEIRNTAYHEGGHALVAAAMNYTDPVTKVTILPRGRALGYTSVMPTEDRYSITRNQLLDQISYAMGGRVAEEVVFHDPTSGASNDIEKATDIAHTMVTEYGMTSELGAVKLDDSQQRQMALYTGHQQIRISEEVISKIDNQVREIVENAHNEAYWVIMHNRDILDNLVKALLEKETLNEAELAEIFKDVKKIEKRPVWLSNKNRKVSEIPPIELPKPVENSDENKKADEGRVAGEVKVKKVVKRDISDKKSVGNESGKKAKTASKSVAEKSSADSDGAVAKESSADSDGAVAKESSSDADKAKKPAVAKKPAAKKPAVKKPAAEKKSAEKKSAEKKSAESADETKKPSAEEKTDDQKSE